MAASPWPGCASASIQTLNAALGICPHGARRSLVWTKSGTRLQWSTPMTSRLTTASATSSGMHSTQLERSCGWLIPTLNLMDAHVVYIMGMVNLSDEKALVLTVDMANKRLQEVSVYDAERIVNDFRYAFTQSTVSQYFTAAAAGVKGNLKRSLKFHVQYPHKRQCEIINRTDVTGLCEPLQLDIGSDMEIKDETEDNDNPMDLE